MKKCILFSIIFLTATSVFSQNIIGNWAGNIEAGGQKLPIVFHFYKDSSGNLTGKWDSPKQKAINLPFSSIDVDKDSVRLGVKMIAGSYKGKFVNKDSITGMWHQGGDIALNFSRFTGNAFPEQQEVMLPDEKEIIVTTTDGIKLYGTLLSKNKQQKLAIIIAGSGPTDRNGNNPLGDDAASYKLLAHAMDSQNIATFRYDKRGVAKSFSEKINLSKTLFTDGVKDAESIFKYMHDTLGFKNVYFIGHSEGSLIGIIASAHETPVKGFVSVAGMGRPFDKVVEEQLNNRMMPDSLKNKVTYIFNELKNGKEVNDVPESLNMLFAKPVQPYLISLLQYSPAIEIKKLKCPILILQGTCDKQIKVEDAENLHKANTKSTLEIIPLMTHTLKNAEEGCIDENDKTYHDASLPLNATLVSDIVGFINQN